MNYSKMTKAELIKTLERVTADRNINKKISNSRNQEIASLKAQLGRSQERLDMTEPFERVCRLFCVNHDLGTNAEDFKDWVNERLDSEQRLKQHVGVQFSTIEEMQDKLEITENLLDIEREEADHLSAKLNDANNKLDAYKTVLIDIVRE